MSKRKIVVLSNIILVIVAMLGAMMVFLLSPSNRDYNSPSKSVISLDVNGFDELKNALAQEGDKEITLQTNIEFSETLLVNGNVTILADGEVALKRGADFDGSVLEIEGGGV